VTPQAEEKGVGSSRNAALAIGAMAALAVAGIMMQKRI